MKRATKGSGGFTKVSTGWRYRVWIDLPDGSRQRKSFTGKTQAACRKALEEYQNSLSAVHAVPKYRTLGDWGDVWLASKKGRVVYGTYHNYELYWEQHIKPALGHLELDKIIPVQVNQFLAEKRHLSLSTQDAIRGELSQIFRAGIKNGVCTKNPMVGVDSIPNKDPDIRVFSIDEINRIVGHVSENPNGLPILAMLYTGCRFEEIAALMWGDIGENVICIRRAVVKSETGGWEIRERTKSGHDRIVGINPNMQQLLDNLPHKSMYVFPRTDGRHMTYDYFYPKYKRYLEESCVPYLSIHKCRHSYATYLLRGCSDFRIVQEALGHSDPRVTMRYTHPDASDQIRAAKKLAY